MANYIEIESKKDKLPAFLRERMLTTKEDLLKDVKIRTETILESLSNSNRHTMHYYNRVEELLKVFYNQLEDTVLPKKLEDWWFYSYEISYRGVGLYLEHMGSATVNKEKTDSSSQDIDQVFVLVFVPAKMLTVDEYSKLYEVEQVTVRQWIRRCKLRTVEKEGKEWRISELTDIPKRGFEPAQYRWRKELFDLPEGFEFLNEYKLATLIKDPKDDAFKILFTEGRGPSSKTIALELTDEERLTLETYFIANRDVSFASESHAFWWKFITKADNNNKGKEDT